VADLTQRIQVGELRPGDKLPTESEIVRGRGVSRTVVREAISRLQAAGLVETRHGIGSFVLAPASAPQGTLRIDPATLNTVRDIISILELRIALETEAASLAALRRTDSQLGEMRGALDDFQAAVGNQGNCVGADIRFHLAIAQATGNPHFSDFMKHLGEAIIPRARVNTAKLAGDDFAAYLYRVNREHEDIFNAIRRQDPEAARAAMRTHLSNSRERLVRVQEEAERPPA
jgi:DNA-binding FadR family transcriptional regulator